MYTTLAALTAGLAATAFAFDCNGPYFSFYNRGGPSLSYQRLDPALFPGQESPHLHSFDGGNALAASMSFDTTQSSSCTTARIKPDKSLYWRPSLYWNGNNTGFYRVPDQYLKIYYKFGDPGNVKANVTEFPANFRMMAGNPFLRSDDGSNAKGPNVEWSCHGENYVNTNGEGGGFPKGFTSCPNGFATQITFPACWNGNDLDTSKPNAHMAWPTESGLGIDACPEGFKHTRFPTIFIEFWYDISSFDGQYSADSIPWVLANGDPTGHGFHADFLNGWETGVLAKATADDGYCNCGCGCGNDQMKTCFGADNVNDDGDEEFKSCSASAEYPGEDASPLEKLPGCNPVQSGPALATQASGAGCVATAAPAVSVSSKTSAVASSAGTSGAASSAAAISSAVASSAAAASVGSSSAVVSSAASSAPQSSKAAASLSVSIPNKGYGDASYGFATPSITIPTASSSSMLAASPTTALSDGGSLGLVFDDTVTDSSVSLPAVTSSPEETDCKPPVYVTITPTVYVTVGQENAGNSTDCANTYYTTFTNRVTVTVQPTGTGRGGHGHASVHSGY